MQTLSDAELVAQTLAGNERAFTEIYRRYAPKLLARLRRVLGSTQGAEDVLQEVFIQVSQKLHQYQPERSLGGWLHGFSFNIASRHLRSRRRRWWSSSGKDWAIDCASDVHAKSPEAAAIDQQLTQHLYKAMDHLSPKNRAAFAMHELEGLGVTEIGQMLDMSPQAAWGRVERARKQVLKHLAPLAKEKLLADVLAKGAQEAEA